MSDVPLASKVPGLVSIEDADYFNVDASVLAAN